MNTWFCTVGVGDELVLHGYGCKRNFDVGCEEKVHCVEELSLLDVQSKSGVLSLLYVSRFSWGEADSSSSLLGST